MKGWLKDRRLCICILLAVLIIYHLYFLWLSSVKMELSELLYADFMLLVVIGVCTVSDWYRWIKKTEGWQNAMQTASYVLIEELDDTGELQTVLAHNEQEYLREQKEHYMQQQELQDYISRWSHEIKLPLAALRMMNERYRCRLAEGYAKAAGENGASAAYDAVHRQSLDAGRGSQYYENRIEKSHSKRCEKCFLFSDSRGL